MPLGYRVKFLINRLSILEEQLVQTNKIFFEGVAEINNLLNNDCNLENKEPQKEPQKENKCLSTSKPDPEKSETPVEPKTQKSSDPKVKKLFRKIALKIHPDKLTGMPDGPSKQKLVGLFQNAMSFNEDNNYANLAAIAIKLGIDVEDFSEKDLKIIKEKITIIKKKIKNIESTLIWKWIFEENETIKEKILEKLLKTINEKAKKNSRS